jgi:hypothetical protein
MSASPWLPAAWMPDVWWQRALVMVAFWSTTVACIGVVFIQLSIDRKARGLDDPITLRGSDRETT